jgi:hypothetical protein
MNWTREKPTQPGWYWFRGQVTLYNDTRDTVIHSKRYDAPEVFEVIDFHSVSPGVVRLGARDVWTSRNTEAGSVSIQDTGRADRAAGISASRTTPWP